MNNITNFNEWIPEVCRVPIDEYATITENAILTGKYGV